MASEKPMQVAVGVWTSWGIYVRPSKVSGLVGPPGCELNLSGPFRVPEGGG